jgi:23S rRNA (cytidine1920-2'-O)/16S rRNA (cytidine1409-2'-O)-methyltransferase
MAKPARLDTELVRRALVRSREEARRLIESGGVTVNGIPAFRAATMVPPGVSIALTKAPSRFVSRGGEKLNGALDDLDVPIEGRRWLDAGASTGGFTDVLIQRGAAEVVAVDVGYGQLHWRLRTNPQVTVLDRVNVRYLVPEQLPWRPEGIVADLSFISLTLVLPALVGVAAPDADHVLLVKPQFEVGRGAVPRGGVVRDPAGWRSALEAVTSAAAELGLGVVGAAASRLPGPAGNREFFVHLKRGSSSDLRALDAAVEEAR